MSDIVTNVVSFIPLGVGLILQYALLAVLYIFIYKVTRMIYKDLFNSETAVHQKKSASLTVIADENGGLQRKYMFEDFITIGRKPDNDIVLNDKYVSHYHAHVKRIGDEYVLVDLDSINNTYLNDEELSGETVLESGDHIRLGMVVLKFER